MLEKEIERKVCKYAQEKRIATYKFTSPGHRSVPDRMFITEIGYLWFVEFKRKGMKPTPLQEREHQRLRDRGMLVVVIDTVEDGIEMVDRIINLL